MPKHDSPCERWCDNPDAAGRPRIRCGKPSTHFVIASNGLRVEAEWYACPDHAPKPNENLEVIDLRCPCGRLTA